MTRWRALLAPTVVDGSGRGDAGQAARTPRPSGSESGFTLIELMIVLTIVGILLTIAQPSYHTQIVKAREAALRKDLYVMRDVIDQFSADQGRYPDGLRELVDQQYLRGLPVDPMTKSSETWIEVRESEPDESGFIGVFDVHSGSNLVASDGTTYNEW